MSGRLVDLEDDTRAIMSILPISLVALTEMNSPLENSAAIQSEYLERRTMRIRAGKKSATMVLDEPDTPYVMGGRRATSPMRGSEPFKLPKKERMGMSAELGGYLEELPKREAEKRERRSEPFPSRYGKKTGQLGVPDFKAPPHKYPAEHVDTLRKEVLSVSLFPNLYNRSNLLKAM